MGINDQPQVQNYASVLKEKQNYQRGQKRAGEVSGLMRGATEQQTPPPVQEEQPLPGSTHYTGMQDDPWGDTPPTPPPSPQPEQQPLTQRRVYEDVAGRSQEQGVAQPTMEEARQYGLDLYQTDEDLKAEEAARKKAELEQKKLDDLNKHRGRLLKKGYKNKAIDETQDKLDYISDEKKRTSTDISRLEGQKRQYMSLKQTLEKGLKSGKPELDTDAMAALDGIGIDSGVALTDPTQAIADLESIIMQKSAEVKVAQKESNDISRSYAELLEDPQAKLTDILKGGRETARDGEGMTRPRALGGPAQIQARQPAQQGEIVKVVTPDDYHRLANGTRYMTPTGAIKIKGKKQ